MDDLRIYDRELSSNQIKLIFENKTNILHSQETSTNDYWHANITVNDGGEDSDSEISNPIVIL